MQSQAENITVNYTPREGGGSGNLQSLQDTILAIMELGLEVDRLEEDLKNAKAEITTVILRVPNPVYRTVLKRRYVWFQSWEEIGTFLVMDQNTLRVSHKRAVKSVTEMLKS